MVVVNIKFFCSIGDDRKMSSPIYIYIYILLLAMTFWSLLIIRLLRTKFLVMKKIIPKKHLERLYNIELDCLKGYITLLKASLVVNFFFFLSKYLLLNQENSVDYSNKSVITSSKKTITYIN
jgi:hypothetical protein